MKTITSFGGRIKKTYDIRLTLGKLNSKVFMTRRAVKLDKKTIKRAVTSKKYLVKDLLQQDSGACLSFDFAKLNDFSLETFELNSNLDTCGIYAYKTIVNGKPIVELCLIKTYRDQDSESVSLYYIPNGDIRDLTFVARVCKHNNIEHVNSNGEKIKKGQIHLHVATENQFDKIYSTYKDRGEKVVLEKLQSPDAVSMEKIINDETFESYSRKFFNISDENIIAISDIKQKKGYYIEDGKIIPGISDKTLVDRMAEGMEM